MEEERGALGNLEEMVLHLLSRYQELKREKDELSDAMKQEQAKRQGLEKKLDVLSQDKEQVKERIDQLLHRLKGMDL